MQITPQTLPLLAQQLLSERLARGWSRAEAAAHCGVSTSFIRDAESHPGRCSLARLLDFCGGMGLLLTLEAEAIPAT